jgi:hypothetical protein
MSLSNSTLKRPSPSFRSVDLFDGVTGSLPAPFESVLWCLNCSGSTTHVRVTFAGAPQNLIAARCATPELLAPYVRGRTVSDSDGDRVLRAFRSGYVRLERYKPIALALQLPGITIGAIRAAKARQIANCPWLSDCPDLSAYEMPRPRLRLVIDNTVKS